MNKLLINEQFISTSIAKKKGKGSHLISNAIFYDSIYDELTSSAHENIKSAENQFIHQLLQAKMTVNKLVDSSFASEKRKNIVKTMQTNKKGSLFIRKSVLSNEASMFHFGSKRSSSIGRLLSPRYQSSLNSNIPSPKKSNKGKPFPKLFATALDTINDTHAKVSKDSPNETHKNYFFNTNSNSQSSFQRKTDVFKKNCPIKLMYKKCLELISKDSELARKKMSTEHNFNKKELFLIRQRKKSSYEQFNNETIALFNDDKKWKALGKKIESAMDKAVHDSIHSDMSPNMLKDKRGDGGYLFDTINSHSKNKSERKAKKTQKGFLSFVNFIDESARFKDVLIKKLESNNKVNMNSKRKERGQGRYFNVNGCFSNSKEKKQFTKFMINKSL